jgi:hypothetical protein
MFTGGHLLKRVPAWLTLVSVCAVARQTVAVTIQGFSSREVRIKAGDTMRWTQ